MGFNIQATEGTALFLKQNGIRTHKVGKLSDGSKEITDAIRQGYVTYVINTRDMNSSDSLDTVKVLLDVLEETTLGISTIDA